MNGAFHRCVVPDGVNELDLPATRLEWCTADGRCTVSRNVGTDTYWARVDGRSVGEAYGPIRDPMNSKRVISGLTRAMQAALGAAERKAPR